MPETFSRVNSQPRSLFSDSTVGYLLLGIGFLASLAILLIGQGAGYRVTGPERLLFVLGSLATYGFVTIYLGVEAELIIFAIIASAVISAVSLWTLRPSEITRDPVGAFIVPGTFLAGVALIIWAVIVGGAADLAMKTLSAASIGRPPLSDRLSAAAS